MPDTASKPLKPYFNNTLLCMPRTLPVSELIQWVIVPLLCHRLLPFRIWFCRSQVTMLRFNAGTLALGKHKKGTEMWGKRDESPDEEERTSFLNQLLLDRVLHGAEDAVSILGQDAIAFKEWRRRGLCKAFTVKRRENRKHYASAGNIEPMRVKSACF